MKIRKTYRPKRSCVYVATNLINEKRYIGVTCRYLCHRKYHHFRSARIGSQAAFHRAIRKYGRDAFIFTVLGWYESFDAAKAGEVKMIAVLQPEYNMTVGGDGSVGYRHTEAERVRISERNKGRPGFWRGKGIPPGFLVRTPEWREKVGAANRGKTRTLEQIVSLRRGRGSSVQDYKGIVCLNDGRQYPTMASAAKAYGIKSSSGISAVCLVESKKKQKTVNGLVFRFFGDHYGGKEEAARVLAAARASQKSGLGPNYRKKVVRLADNVVYETVKDAAEQNLISDDIVMKSCKGRYKYNTPWRDKFCYLDEWCPNPL